MQHWHSAIKNNNRNLTSMLGNRYQHIFESEMWFIGPSYMIDVDDILKSDESWRISSIFFMEHVFFNTS